MDDKQTKWRQFQKLKVDRKLVRRRAKKAETATVRHARKFIVRRLENIHSVRRHVFFWLVGVACLIGSVGVQMMWFNGGYTTSEVASSTTYAEGIYGDITTINPLFATTAPEQAASKLIFSSLFEYDVTGHLKGDLVRGMTITNNSRTYRLELKPGVRWHDGVKLTANDVAFTIDLIKDPNTRSPLQPQWRDVTVEVINPLTLQLSLPAVYSPFPHALTFSVLPEHKLKDVAPGVIRQHMFSLSPIGSGPFEARLLQSGKNNTKILNLTAFRDYYGGRAKLDRFEIHAFASQDDMLSALQVGKVNALVDTGMMNEANIPAGLVLREYPVNEGAFAFFNTSRPATKDRALRRALQAGLNVDAVRKGKTPLDLPFVEGQIDGAMPSVATYDADRASKLLTDAGWKLVGGKRKKGNQELRITVATLQLPQYQRVARQMKDDWGKLGVGVDVLAVDPSDSSRDFTREVLQTREYDVLIHGLSIGADPDVYAYWHSSQVGASGLNLSVYKNSIVDDALASARSRTEQNLRELKYNAFARQWVSDVPAIGLFQASMRYITTGNTTSMSKEQRLVSPVDRYANVRYWSTGHATVYNTP